ncbi:PhzF family phenazine biosynthesis isomerase [Bacillus gobiensis]|uniref:PhzF family phenazine biosynthesis isomerase n=1 Tax=Bacillus gobiensis TaxID=1441095 RepID=UPI003D25C41C
MKPVTVYHYDAFSRQPNMGNPAGVVLTEGLSEEEMQLIAKKVGFNETAFPMKSEKADVRIRYFTPGHEINLCGHATMASIYALKTRNLLADKNEFTIETKAGVLPVKIEAGHEDDFAITMQQAAPEFKPFKGSKKALAAAIGLHEDDLHPELPIVYGSTGAWTLLVPVANLSAFGRMVPNNSLFPEVLTEMPKASIHPFCLETYDPLADMHARHFSSPFSGTIEDPVTGTASGVMGAYYASHIKENPSLELLIEQGHELNRDGRVAVFVSKNDSSWKIEIRGQACFVKEMMV